MLTKTKKWLSVFALAIVAVLLVGCKKTEVVEEPVNPTAIEISMDAYVGEEEGVLVGGEEMLLSIIPTPANGIKTVTWTSADPTIATVNDQGHVTGLKGGRVMIKAVSTVDANIFHEVEIMVYESFNKSEVLVNAMNEIKNKMPKFVNDDFQLPSVTNTLVTVEYFDGANFRHTNNVYKYNYTFDVMELVNVKLSYEGQKLDFSTVINVVEDLENNEFTAIEAASDLLDEFFADYKKNKVAADIELPSTFTIGEGEEAFVVNVTWESTNTNVFSSAGVYSRPNDDTKFQLEGYLVAENVSKVVRHDLVSTGYTQEEKVAYITENTLPTLTEIKSQNITLPAMEFRFGARIEWTSSDEEVLTSLGKMNPFLAEESTITLTAKIIYAGTTGPEFAFEEEVTMELLVKPSETDLERAVLDLSNRIDSDKLVPTYFPYGAAGRDTNALTLPAKVGGTSEYADADIVWTSSEAGLFDANWTLLKQYLRYHTVILTFSVTSGEETVTGEHLMNVGVAEMANTVYIGGRFSSTNMGPTAPTDGVHTISAFDKGPDGNVATTFTYGKWNGLTFYVDVENASGISTRYQYFASTRYTWVLKEGGDNGVNIDEDGMMTLVDPTKKIMSQTGDTDPNYQYFLFHNNTEKDVQLPIAFLNYESSVTRDVNDKVLGRQVSISIDGWRTAFVSDATGKVTFGFGAESIEPAMTAIAEADPDSFDDAGNMILQEYVTVPAGGYAYSPATTQASPTVWGHFSTVDTEINFVNFGLHQSFLP